MRVRVNPETIKWLREKRLYFEGGDTPRLTPGCLLEFFVSATIEPYAAIFSGYNVFEMGSFSFSHSQFPIDTKIGRYCSIAWNVRVPGPNHPTSLLSSSSFMYDRDYIAFKQFKSDSGTKFQNYQPNPQKSGVIIGHDVWIGQDVSIMRGLEIGNGAVIASESVVTKSVPPYAIVGGNPARVIKFRFNQEIIGELQTLKWWRFRFTDFEGIDLSNINAAIRAIQTQSTFYKEYTPVWTQLSQMPGEKI